MSVITRMFQDLWKYIISVGWRDVLDIAIVSVLAYHLLRLVHRSNAMRVLKGIGAVVAVWFAAEFFNLYTLNFLLTNFIQVGLIALVVVFQPELRKALEQVGAGSIKKFVSREMISTWENAIIQTVEACKMLSWAREGALIVFERNIHLNDFIKTGTIINADLTAELLRNIFYPKAPMHDGAVIVQNARVSGAGCMLPLSGNQNLSRDLGMRHRAGIGISEQSDSVVVIVSEETGSISVAADGMLKRHLTSETLEKLLRNEFIPQEEKERPLADLIKSFLRGNRNE
ncbi:MAG: diadenylate cyclase CdaA [Oscillospiraceae bacterium]|nr:diadenylate cyclase CdaA [Oscillospiraceae bacterium]